MLQATHSRPVFIVGCPRSGTTLVRRIVDAHPAIACPPESKFIAGFIPMLRHPSVLEGLRGMGFAGRELYALLRNMIELPFRLHASRHGKARWADKTPNYYRILDFIDDIFEGQALFLFVVRHPFDTAESCEEVFREIGQRFLDNDGELREIIDHFGGDRYGFLKYWSIVNERLSAFALLNPGRAQFVKYEALIAAPMEILPSMFAFVGESYSPAMLENAFRGGPDAGIEDPKFRRFSGLSSKQVGRSRSWSEEQKAGLWPLVAAIAEPLGYTQKV